MRILLDTDVNLDFVLARQPFFVAAQEIYVLIAQKKIEAFVSSITPINIYYFGRKEKGRLVAIQELQKLLKLVNVCVADKHILQKALTSPITDYEDAVQHECALAENLDAIVTRNVKDYKNASLPIFTPADFLQEILKHP